MHVYLHLFRHTYVCIFAHTLHTLELGLESQLMGSSLIAEGISQPWHTKPPLQHSAASSSSLCSQCSTLFLNVPNGKRSSGTSSIGVYINQCSALGKRMFLISICGFSAALISGWVCWTPSSTDKVCKPPQPATMSQLFHFYRGTPPHW